MKVAAFNGSPRPKGNTSILLRVVLKELEQEGIETELTQVGGTKMQGCIACYKCFENKNRRCAVDKDTFNDYLSKMDAADGILLGSPTYFADVSAWTKALIERAGLVSRANDYMFKGKVGAAVTAVRRAGGIPAFNSMNLLFLYGQMIVPGSTYWNVGIGRNPGDVEGDEEGIQTMRNLGRNMAWLLKKLHA
jgi:multimeric flavodoxin WrbA